jgi:hypothetical protein
VEYVIEMVLNLQEYVRFQMQIFVEFFRFQPPRLLLVQQLQQRRMPDLVESAQQNVPVVEIRSTPQSPIPPQELPPTFLNDLDYPVGWKVYHSVLGVVDKETADAYDKQRVPAAGCMTKQDADEEKKTDHILLSDDELAVNAAAAATDEVNAVPASILSEDNETIAANVADVERNSAPADFLLKENATIAVADETDSVTAKVLLSDKPATIASVA